MRPAPRGGAGTPPLAPRCSWPWHEPSAARTRSPPVSGPCIRASRRRTHAAKEVMVMPPAGVKKGSKRARQYEHIKDSLKEQGRSEDTAEEIAARTVNKERARHGESKTASKTSTQDRLSSGQRGGQRSGTNRAKGR